ncbi:MAG: NifB/NifX family molybdenum-iron cluster-binding protein [Thermodesulfobacteriota bacterium]|nr:NifB/NifX family molybdenum-iron cluster-binding protein [Thermodesulfobacteriota bacterium]
MKTRSTSTFFISLFLFLLFTLSSGASADAVKIAVASTGQEKDSSINHQAGRTPFFLFFDEQGNFLDSVVNPARDQAHRAGPSAALFLAQKGVTFLIAENFGNKMELVMQEHHIQYAQKSGLADKAVQEMIQSREP